MGKIKALLVFTGFLITFTNCKHLYTEGFNTYFWTSTAGEKVYLYIDGKNKGELPYLTAAPDCDNEASKKDALKIYLPSHSYLIQVKDETENILFTEELRIWKRGGSISLGNTTSGNDGGGSRRSFKDQCLIEQLFYTKQ